METISEWLSKTWGLGKINLKTYNKKKYCSKECAKVGAVCDFCKFYDIDKWYCDKHNKEKRPEEGCKDFVCFKIEESE